MSDHHCCELEGAVLQASRSDRWSDDLREHAAICEHCAEAIFVAHHLATVAGEVEGRPLADARAVFLRSRLEERRTALHRATMVITVMQAVAGVVGAGVALFAITWLWPALKSSAAAIVSDATPGADSPEVVVLASFLVIVILALAEMWPRVGATR